MTAPALPPLLDVLVTGTDTGVGKTWVTAALAAACVADGLRVAVLKAAQTGGDDDAAWIAARVPGVAVATALRYEAAVAPSVAARLEGAPEPSLEPIVAAARELRAASDGILVEGSGGLLVPINDRETFADLARALELPLLIVARPGLGTLNHTALTVAVARTRGLTVAGVVVCGTSAEPDVAERTNMDELRRLAPVLGAIPHDPGGLAGARYGPPVIDLHAIEEQMLGRGEPLAREDAMRIAELPPDRVPELCALAHRVRLAHCGPEVSVESIVSAKTGGCSEDCAFCSQSARFPTPVRAAWLDVDGMVEAARRSQAAGATEFCIVVAVRGPDERLLSRTLEATAAIKRETKMQVACSLGLLDDEQARRLAEGGIDRYNHNLEASRSFFPEICTSHSFDDRYETCLRARAAGMELCSGGVVGMGETWEQRVELAYDLASLDPDEVPLNFLNPRPGTPLEGRDLVEPLEALKAIALFRLVLPRATLRYAGGREVTLRELQALGLVSGINALIVGNYLTTLGRSVEDDLQMLDDLRMPLRPLAEAL